MRPVMVVPVRTPGRVAIAVEEAMESSSARFEASATPSEIPICVAVPSERPACR